MTSSSRPMLASVYDLSVVDRKSRPIAALMDIAALNAQSAPRDQISHPTPEVSKRRVHIWELNASLHCSIIGTCLSAGELRRLLVKLEISGAATADDHDMHMLGVLLAGRPKEGAKHLQKALDRRHRGAITRFARVKDPDAIQALWDEAFDAGDVPGAYWALLTHPQSTDQAVRRAFGDVHMLSHLVGATNRADLARLRGLEAQNTALVDKIERQQRQLRDGFTGRDETIRRLNDLLAQKIARETDPESAREHHDADTLKNTIAALNQRLARETERRERLEQRLEDVSRALHDSERTNRTAMREHDAMRAELSAMESEMTAMLCSTDTPVEPTELRGITVLYVGGRANQAPQFRAMLERIGGHFLHHDGGIEHSAALLPSLVGRADLSVFPVDCVSHDAMASVKRVCRQLEKPYLALRTASLTCLLSALSDYRQASHV